MRRPLLTVLDSSRHQRPTSAESFQECRCPGPHTWIREVLDEPPTVSLCRGTCGPPAFPVVADAVCATPLRPWRLLSVTAIGLTLLLAGCSGVGAHRAASVDGTDAVVTGTSESAAANTAKQLAYAMEHWNDYNTAEYGDLNPVGGDCANFVSQTLIARGWKMNARWFNHDAAADWSPAWGYVPAMENYLRANAAQLGITRYPLDQRDTITVGDIVIFDWDDNDSLDHVQIVSAVEKTGTAIRIKMVGHNVDTDYRDLDKTITVDHPGAVGHFWALSK